MEKLKYAFNKIKNGFIMFFCIIWISMIASFMAVSRAEGGAEVNGFLCFIFWIICVFLAVKKTHPVIISVISTVVMLGIRVYKFGIGDIGLADNGGIGYCWDTISCLSSYSSRSENKRNKENYHIPAADSKNKTEV